MTTLELACDRAPINRTVFYNHVRKSVFKGRFSNKQFKGMETLLDVWDLYYRPLQPLIHLAASFGTTYHETAETMQPIKEYGGNKYFFKMYDMNSPSARRRKVAARLGNNQPGDGVRFPGRGYVQTTGRSNYGKVSYLVSKIMGKSVDFVKNPELLYTPIYAAHALFAACDKGIYTGRGWSRYFKSEEPTIEECVKSRYVVNGTDKANLIAGYIMAFWEALDAATRPPVSMTAPPALRDTVTPATGGGTDAQEDLSGASHTREPADGAPVPLGEPLGDGLDDPEIALHEGMIPEPMHKTGDLMSGKRKGRSTTNIAAVGGVGVPVGGIALDKATEILDKVQGVKHQVEGVLPDTIPEGIDWGALVWPGTVLAGCLIAALAAFWIVRERNKKSDNEGF